MYSELYLFNIRINTSLQNKKTSVYSYFCRENMKKQVGGEQLGDRLTNRGASCALDLTQNKIDIPDCRAQVPKSL